MMKWKITITDIEGNSFEIDRYGREKAGDYFKGSEADAARESDRRADLWENLNCFIAVKIEYEIVKKRFQNKD